MVKFWSQIYKKWNPTNKIMFWLTILSIGIGIFFGGIENSSLTNSPIIRSSANISIIYPSIESDSGCPQNYESIFNIKNSLNYNMFFIKVIFPDNKVGFIDKFLINQSINLGQCLPDSSDCCIYNKYRVKRDLKDDEVCGIFTTRLGHDEMQHDILQPSNRFFLNSSSCLNLNERVNY